MGRVATGSYPPVAPTDLDLPNSRIRLLGLWFLYASVYAMDEPWRRESVVLGQTVEAGPCERRTLAAPSDSAEQVDEGAAIGGRPDEVNSNCQKAEAALLRYSWPAAGDASSLA